MKKYSLLLLSILFCSSLLFGQTVPEGINYQALFRNDDGSPMANQRVQIEVNLTSSEKVPEVYYQELHDLMTNELGLLSIPIGKGKFPINKLSEVPWAKGNIWLSIAILENGNYREITKNELLSVPYAMHAASAKKLTKQGEASLRGDVSIYWLTSGNTKSEPHVHFIGTNDEMDFYIKTNARTRYVIDKDGLVTLYAEKTSIQGDDTDKGAYPLVIERAKHGIYIELNVKEASSDNNFVTFADPEGIHGSIEGQTLAECFSDPFYIIDKILTAADLAFAIKGAVDQFSEASEVATDGVGAAASPGAILNGTANAIFAAYQGVAQIRDLALKIVEVGVNYNSGGADYAEWLPKELNTRDLFPGEIVGVKNGKISLNTDGAERIMVISSNPIVVGNTPKEEEKIFFEKVAFLGQVYVSVLGDVKAGDYILPSGNNDGFAIAVAPEKMQTGDYHRIIGVAWEDAKSQNGLSNAIKVAVGINANDLSDKVANLELKADRIISYLKGESPLPEDGFEASLAEKLALAQQQPITSLGSQLSNEQFDQLIDAYGPFFEAVYGKSEEMLAERGFYVSDYPELQQQFKDPTGFFKELKRDQRYASQIAALELALQKNN